MANGPRDGSSSEENRLKVLWSIMLKKKDVNIWFSNKMDYNLFASFYLTKVIKEKPSHLHIHLILRNNS